MSALVDRARNIAHESDEGWLITRLTTALDHIATAVDDATTTHSRLALRDEIRDYLKDLT